MAGDATADRLRKLIRAEREPTIYVIGFKSGIVKVGHTTNLRTRIDAHRTDAVFRDDEIVRVWESDQHVNARQNEQALIDFCAARWSEAFGREYFADADFDAVAEYAKGLRFERLTEQEMDEALARHEERVASGEILARLMRPKPKRSAIATLRLRHERLAKARESAGLTGEAELAAAMGFTSATISRVLNGKANPGPDFIASLLAALKSVAFEDIWEITVRDSGESK